MNYYEELLYSGENRNMDYGEREITVSDLFACEEYMAIGEQLVMYSELESVKSGNEVKYHTVLSKHEMKLTGEVRDLYLDTLSVLGAVYGMNGEGFMDSVKSAYKSVEVYARKFIAMVGKWIAKAMVRWKLNSKLAKELAQRYDKYSDDEILHLDKEDIEKLGSIIDQTRLPDYLINANDTPEAAELLVKNESDFKNRFECKLVKLISTIDGTKTEIGMDKLEELGSRKEDLFNPVDAIKRALADDPDIKVSFYMYIDVHGKETTTWTAGVVSKIEVEENGEKHSVLVEVLYTVKFKKGVNLGPGDVELSDLGIYPEIVASELRTITPELMKARIDARYEDIKEILDLSTVKNADDPVKAKQVMIDASKLAFKDMMNLVKSQNDKVSLYKILADKIDEHKNKNK